MTNAIQSPSPSNDQRHPMTITIDCGDGDWIALIMGWHWSLDGDGDWMALIIGRRWSLDGDGHWMTLVIGWRWSLDGDGHWMALIIGWRWSPMTNTNAIQSINAIQVTIAIQ